MTHFFLLVKIDLFWNVNVGVHDVSVQGCEGTAEKGILLCHKMLILPSSSLRAETSSGFLCVLHWIWCIASQI